jgi:hypothetical protein
LGRARVDSEKITTAKMGGWYMADKNCIPFVGTLCFVAGRLAVLSLASTVAAVAQNPLPAINLPLVPDAVTPGGAGFTLTVNGTGFVSGAVVNWNGSARTTTFINRSQLTAAILASDIANPGTALVSVVNPGRGNTSSGPALFQITYRTSAIALAGPVDYGSAAFTSVAIGDLNGDGIPDLALADWDNEMLGVMLGNGDGTFKPVVEYPVGLDPQSVVVADFNGDGKLDAAIANSFSSTVSVLLGNGDGTFRTAVNYITGSSPYCVVVGDFNGDGKLDLALANNGGNTVSILLGNGDGTFGAAGTFSAGVSPISLTLGDFNGDDKLDLAVANSGEASVSILLGNGDGTFKTPINYAAGSQPDGVTAADLNGDGKLDLAVANSASNSVSIFLGNGDGTFQEPMNYSVGSEPSVVIAADLNGDGDLDLAVANFGSNRISILLGNGDGTFQAVGNYGVNLSGAWSIAAGDFNGDGKIDLATSGRFAVSVRLQIPAVGLSRMTVGFGDSLIGTTSAAEAITLTNTGGLILTISSVTIGGVNAGDFDQTNDCGSGLYPDLTCTITVTFKATQKGPRSAFVSITDDATGSPQQIALSGTGLLSGPDATLLPANLTFPTQIVGTPSAGQPVTLSNYGTAALSISSIAATGDFNAVNACGSNLAAGASCTISVSFNPTQIDTRNGTLSVNDNALGSPHSVSLTGQGTVVRLSPPTLSVACQHRRLQVCPPTTRTASLTNTGSRTLTISSISISGFSQTNNCPSTLPAQASCTITVTFRSGFSAGTFSGAVSISDNGGASPQQVGLLETVTIF